EQRGGHAFLARRRGIPVARGRWRFLGPGFRAVGDRLGRGRRQQVRGERPGREAGGQGGGEGAAAQPAPAAQRARRGGKDRLPQRLGVGGQRRSQEVIQCVGFGGVGHRGSSGGP